MGPKNASIDACSTYNCATAVPEFPAWEGMVREYVGELVAAGAI
jgi:hypothetical protein